MDNLTAARLSCWTCRLHMLSESLQPHRLGVEVKQFKYSILAVTVLALFAGCQSKVAAPAAASEAGLIPIAVGAYVAQDESCADRVALFRYDGTSMGWSGGAERPMYPIVRVRKEQDQWVATIVSPGPGVDGHKRPRELDVYIVPRGGGRLTVTAMERIEMKFCTPAELPAWAR